MGKKGKWFSAIKRVFTHNSKEKPSYGSDKKSSKEKKTGKLILRHGETKSFIPRFREPSSIEKILGEADQLVIQPSTYSEEPKTPDASLWRPASPQAASPKDASHRIYSPKAASPKVSSASLISPKAPSPTAVSPRVVFPRAVFPRPVSPRAVSPRAVSPKAVFPANFTTGITSLNTTPPKENESRKETRCVQRPKPTIRDQHLSATMIQAAFRGYLARRNFRALRGLVRLQGVVRGQNANRQTINAMKQMQLLVRVQTQIQSRRIQMLENQALQRQAYRNDKEAESTLSKWTLNQLHEAGHNEGWDDSLLTREEVEARLRKKVEALVKRERAMAYSYSHQLWKANPKTEQTPLDIRSNGFPWWWNWLERQLPPATTLQSQSATKNVPLTPPRPVSQYNPSPQPSPSNYDRSNFASNNHEAATPQSLKSTILVGAKPFRTPPPSNGSASIKNSKPRGRETMNSAFDFPLKDDDSLTSCPAFSVPNYMTPTVSAKAKATANSNPKERIPPETPANDSKRRFSFSLTTNIGSFKWNKGFNKDHLSQKGKEKHNYSFHSVGDLSVDSTVSMPAIVGRKPFNRFV